MPLTERPLVGTWALVASKDRILRARACVGLGGAGMFCDEAATGRAALDRLESMRHDYALVVIDLDLRDTPPGDIEAIAAVTVPGADVIRCGRSDTARTDAAGAWIAKPFLASEFARVVAALREWPQGDAAWGPELAQGVPASAE